MKELSLKPSAKIALKRNVLKMYEVEKTDVVYLKDDAEFEIELFNPLQESVLAKIKINGKFINNGGLIINPGQRIFLERYLDDNKKFKFSTYKVENNNPDVDYAIALNGFVEVFFYKEIAYVQTINAPYWTSTHVYYNSPCYTTPSIFNNDITCTCGTGTTTNNFTNNCSNKESVKYSNMLDSTLNSLKESIEKQREEKETGKIEKGSNSNQVLINSSRTFSDYINNTVRIKILPESEKVYTSNDIKHRMYCSECGNRVKENDKFCASCGTKL